MKSFDITGASCSGLCICHCLLSPLLLAPGLLGSHLLFLESEWVHRLLLIPIAVLAVMTALSILRRQSDWMLSILALLGVGIMLFAIIYEDLFGETFEQIATVIGGLILIALHLLNRRRLLHESPINTA